MGLQRLFFVVEDSRTLFVFIVYSSFVILRSKNNRFGIDAIGKDECTQIHYLHIELDLDNGGGDNNSYQ